MSTIRTPRVQPGTRFVLLAEEPAVVGSLVQVIDVGHQLFGIALIVGDFNESEIHGFHTGVKSRAFATVPVSACRYVGESHIKSKEPCSKEWLAKYPQTQTPHEERDHLRHRDQEGSAGQKEAAAGGS